MNSTTKIVAIDSNILIYTFAQPTSAAAQQHTKHARWLMDHFTDLKAIIHVSQISVSEFLCGIPVSQHPKTIMKLEERFRLAPFNLKAASYAAVMVQNAQKSNKMTESRVIRREGDRPCLMADTKIFASLVAAGVQQIYANDDRFLSLKEISPLPVVTTKLPTQPFSLLQLQDAPENDQRKSDLPARD